MFGLKTFVVGLIAGSVGMLLAMQFHLVRTNDGFTVIPRKHQPPLRSAYVDVRRWSVAMFRNYPEVGEALVRAGRADLIISGAIKTFVPEQTESSLESFPESVGEQTRKAMEALVPIRFTTQPGETGSGSAHPDAAPGQIRPHQVAIEPIGAQASQIASRTDSVDRERLAIESSGLPVLKHPVPLPEETFRPATMNTPRGAGLDLETEHPPADWIRGLLRTLIPQSEEATGPADHGHARLPFDLQAPVPGEEVFPARTWTSPHERPPQAPYRAIRPF